uniref:FAD-dependent oxidoreductase dpasF n=1 Tax=Apiospora sacchari TaxID=166626 RepID=DPASF_APISA|nr:RecName: Full=FAD-dependent oxidoreductase dpasF; AltName: Full=Diterpenoid pyrone biosynthesis cluster protein E; Flags: Precursor [Apiospora sacchari]
MNRLLASALLVGSAVVAPVSAACIKNATVTEVDVAIIGGGASGVYAAARLIDNNKTVVVLERNADRIGGQTETYYDPTTGTPVNVGVKVFSNTTVTTDFLKRFDFPMGTLNVGQTLATGTQYVDFATGKLIPNFTAVVPAVQAAAMQRYAAELAKYPQIKFGYNLGPQVPEDLVLPFGKFMEKHNLTGMAQTMFEFNSGYTPLLEIPALYILKYLDTYELQSLQSGSFIVAANGDSATLYRNAAKFLGERVVYGVSGMHIQRSSAAGGRVTISVGNSTTGTHMIRAKKLIVAAPPTLDNLRSTGLDLDTTEAGLFGKLSAGVFYSLVVKDTGVAKANLRNRHPANPYGFPDQPFIYSVIPLPKTSGLAQVLLGSASPLTASQVEARVAADIGRLPASLRGNATSVPKVVTMAAHTWNVMAPVADIKAGFYDKLEGLQGLKDTWYIGAAWATQSSTTIWEGLEQEFLPKLLAAL